MRWDRHDLDHFPDPIAAPLSSFFLWLPWAAVLSQSVHQSQCGHCQLGGLHKVQCLCLKWVILVGITSYLTVSQSRLHLEKNMAKELRELLLPGGSHNRQDPLSPYSGQLGSLCLWRPSGPMVYCGPFISSHVAWLLWTRFPLSLGSLVLPQSIEENCIIFPIWTHTVSGCVLHFL